MVKNHGHECELSIGQTLNDFHAIIERFKPDMVAFSIMSGSHGWARDMARQVKTYFNIPNIFGGAHPTFFPEFINEEGVDYMIRGEGEEAMLEILTRIDKHVSLEDIPNLSFKNVLSNL